jgi:hypothetical protein
MGLCKRIATVLVESPVMDGEIREQPRSTSNVLRHLRHTEAAALRAYVAMRLAGIEPATSRSGGARSIP